MQGTYGRLILENEMGRVVRTLDWESQSAVLVFRHDTNRIEIHPDLKWLDQEGVGYTIVLDEISRTQLEQKPIEIEGIGRLALVPHVSNHEVSINIVEEDGSRHWWRSLAMSTVGIGGLIFLSLTMPRENLQSVETPTEHVVKLIKERAQEVVEQPVPAKPKVVAPRQALPHSFGRSSGGPLIGGGGSGGGIKRMGALGVLGTLTATGQKQFGGVNLGAIKTTPGPGRGGGSASSGGVQTTLYGRGILSAPLGGGGNIYGSGGLGTDGVGSTGKGGGQDGGGQIALYGANGDGTSSYGTKGKGGGKDGYGQNTMIGSSGGAPVPLGREAIIQGGLDSDMISAVIQKNMGQVRFCYEQGLQGDPKLSGRVAINFIIGTSGLVKIADIGSTSLNSKIVEDCILLRLKSWKFPLPEGGVEVKVSYPFLLRRTGQG